MGKVVAAPYANRYRYRRVRDVLSDCLGNQNRINVTFTRLKKTHPLTDFFSDSGTPESFSDLFEHIPGVRFFVKDREGRLIYGNRALLQQLGLDDIRELIGTKDQDYYPAEYCEPILKDDHYVLSTGDSIVDRVELGFNGPTTLDWFFTTKIPVIEHSGEVKGLIGISRICNDTSLIPQFVHQNGIAGLFKWLKQNSDHRVSTGEMAKHAGVSIRQLRKHFHDTFGTTPKTFELEARLRSASRALMHTSMAISDIATDYGFCDQSAFTNQFKKRLGLTPSQFRLRLN